MNLKIEPNQLNGDDSALNGIQLLCSTFEGRHTGHINSSEGPWGFYRGKRYCDKGFATSFRPRSEPQQGSGDDAAAIDLKLRCSNNDGSISEIVGGDILTFGDWTLEQTCPPETAICGITTQIEGVQGDGALNNINIACCHLPYSIDMLARIQILQ